jgi:hypothetical protein
VREYKDPSSVSFIRLMDVVFQQKKIEEEKEQRPPPEILAKNLMVLTDPLQELKRGFG